MVQPARSLPTRCSPIVEWRVGIADIGAHDGRHAAHRRRHDDQRPYTAQHHRMLFSAQSPNGAPAFELSFVELEFFGALSLGDGA